MSLEAPPSLPPVRSAPLAPEVESLLARVRSRIRWYVVLHGLAVAAAWLGLAFWLSLLVDQPWLWEPSRIARGAILVLVLGVLLIVLARWVIWRVAARIERSSAALLLERQFRQFQDSLVTTVDLAGSNPAPCNSAACFVWDRWCGP
jgi:hypothetical protein